MMDLMDPFAALTIEWTNQATTPAARQAIRAWAATFPALASFDTPAELVAAINRLGDPARSCVLLSDLLVAAGDDDLAARAVLQAVLPGLRRAARRRSRHPTAVGPWSRAEDVAADAVSAGWEAIRANAGARHHRPAAVIVGSVQGRLRRTHDQWRRHAAPTLSLPEDTDRRSQSWTDAAYSAETQATILIAEAARTQVLDPIQAAVLFAVGVAGHTVADTAQAVGLPNSASYRVLRQARAALRFWLDDHPDDLAVPALGAVRHQPADTPAARLRAVASRQPTGRDPRPISPTALAPVELLEDPPMLPLLLTPTQAAQLLGISRSKLYTLINTGQIESVTIDTSRRIPYATLVDYIERLRHPPPQGISERSKSPARPDGVDSSPPFVDEERRRVG